MKPFYLNAIYQKPQAIPETCNTPGIALANSQHPLLYKCWLLTARHLEPRLRAAPMDRPSRPPPGTPKQGPGLGAAAGTAAGAEPCPARSHAAQPRREAEEKGHRHRPAALHRPPAAPPAALPPALGGAALPDTPVPYLQHHAAQRLLVGAHVQVDQRVPRGAGPRAAAAGEPGPGAGQEAAGGAQRLHGPGARRHGAAARRRLLSASRGGRCRHPARPPPTEPPGGTSTAPASLQPPPALLRAQRSGQDPNVQH